MFLHIYYAVNIPKMQAQQRQTSRACLAVSASAVRFLCAWNQMGGALKTNYADVIFSCACRWPIWELTRTMTIDFPEKIARYPCQAHLFANVLFIPIVFFDRILANERSEQAKFKRAARAQHVLRCKLGADTECWLPLGANFAV